MSWLQQAKELKSFSEFKEWALAKQDNTDKVEEGARQIFGLIPLSKEILVNQEIQSYIRCGEALIDNAYDLTDLLATMDNVGQARPQHSAVSRDRAHEWGAAHTAGEKYQRYRA